MSDTERSGAPAALPYIALVVGALFWGGTWPVAKLAWETFPPGALAFFRWFTCFLVMLPFALPYLLRQGPEFRAAVRAHWPKYLFLAFCGMAAFNYLIFRGLHTTTAVNGALLNGATPIYILTLSLFGLGEPGRLRQWLGVLVALPGLILIVTRGDPERLLRLEFVSGDLMVAAAMFFWALYNIFFRKWPAALPGMVLLCFLSLLGALQVLPVWLFEISEGQRIVWSWESAVSAIYLGVFASFGSYVVWNYGLQQVGAASASLFQYLIPVFATVLAVFIVGEAVHWYHLAGAALIIGGIVVSNRGARARATTQPETAQSNVERKSP